jgi:hypothetical protein
MTRSRRPATVALVVAGAVAFSGGTALGYYATGIEGTTVTATAEAGTVTLQAAAAEQAGLYPGGPAADVTVTVTNPFSAPLVVTSLVAAAAGCASPDLQIRQPGGLPFTVPAKGTVTQRLTGVVAIGTGSSNDCQGVDIAVTYAVNGRV